MRDIATYWYKIAKFLYPTCIYHPRRGWSRRNFVKIFDGNKTRMIGLPYGEKLWQHVKPFSSDTGTSRTDKQTELLYQYRASVCWHAIKNYNNSRCWAVLCPGLRRFIPSDSRLLLVDQKTRAEFSPATLQGAAKNISRSCAPVRQWRI